MGLGFGLGFSLDITFHLLVIFKTSNVNESQYKILKQNINQHFLNTIWKMLWLISDSKKDWLKKIQDPKRNL